MTTACTLAWSGDLSHTGSVRPASPVSSQAWQRQPPRSRSFSSQERHGSGIHAVPRKRWKASLWYQMSCSDCVRTFGRGRPGGMGGAGEGRGGEQGGGMGGEGGGVGGDSEKYRTPAVHAFFRPLLEIVRHHVQDAA